MRERSVKKLRQISDAVFDIAYKDDFAFPELHFAFMMLLWGLWVFFPSDTFAAAAGFELLGRTASPYMWGGIAAILGASRIHCLLHRKKINLAVLSLISGWFWVIVAVSFLLSSPANTGFVVYLMLGMFQFWVYKSLLQHT